MTNINETTRFSNFKLVLSFNQVRAVEAGFTGSIQTMVQQMTRSKLFATWTLKVEAGP